jgi:hypothetical protein
MITKQTIARFGDTEERHHKKKALIAAIRWFSSVATDRYEKDDANLYTLVQLLEEIEGLDNEYGYD